MSTTNSLVNPRSFRFLSLTSSFYKNLPLLAAKKAGVPIRIAHSHNTSIDKDFKYILKQYFRKKITKAANKGK